MKILKVLLLSVVVTMSISASSQAGEIECQFGSVKIPAGCVMPGPCPTGFGFFNNACVQAETAASAEVPASGQPVLPSSCATGYVLTQYGCVYQNAPRTSPSTACGVGMIYTQYGCLSQGNCMNGQVQYNNSCYSVQGLSNSNPYGSSSFGFQF